MVEAMRSRVKGTGTGRRVGEGVRAHRCRIRLSGLQSLTALGSIEGEWRCNTYGDMPDHRHKPALRIRMSIGSPIA
jgi:hypothetical protein